MNDLYGHLAINNYYYIQNRIRSIKSNTKYCPICLSSVKCNHELEYKNYKDTKERLNWWSDIAYMSSKSVNLSYDHNKIFPIWPDVNLNLNVIDKYEYTLFPRFEKSMVGIMKDNSDCLLYKKGKITRVNFDVPNGTYWGYMIDKEFRCVRKFNQGKWGYTKAFPNILHMNTKTKTYWAIPSGRLTHWEFYNGLRVVT